MDEILTAIAKLQNLGARFYDKKLDFKERLDFLSELRDLGWQITEYITEEKKKVLRNRVAEIMGGRK